MIKRSITADATQAICWYTICLHWLDRSYKQMSTCRWITGLWVEGCSYY